MLIEYSRPNLGDRHLNPLRQAREYRIVASTDPYPASPGRHQRSIRPLYS